MHTEFTTRAGTFVLIVLIGLSILYTAIGAVFWGVGPFTAGLVAGAVSLTAAVHILFIADTRGIDNIVPWMLLWFAISQLAPALASITPIPLYRALATGGYIATATAGMGYWLYHLGVVDDEWPSAISDRLPARFR